MSNVTGEMTVDSEYEMSQRTFKDAIGVTRMHVQKKKKLLDCRRTGGRDFESCFAFNFPSVVLGLEFRISNCGDWCIEVFAVFLFLLFCV